MIAPGLAALMVLVGLVLFAGAAVWVAYGDRRRARREYRAEIRERAQRRRAPMVER